MKISCRPLKAEAFDVEAEPGDTVLGLKAKVAQAKPDLPADTQKLVFAGKVLQDGATLQDSGIKDGDFLVIMVAKPKPTSSAGVATGASSSPSVPSAPAAAPAQAVVPSAAHMAGMVGGGPSPETIQMLCEMGFGRSDVERALRAAFNNPDRAVDYLMSGIPPHLMHLAEGQPAALPAPPATNPAAHGQPGPGAAGGGMQNPFASGFPQMPMQPPVNATGPLAKLQNNPMFFRLKMAIQQNPGSLNQVLSLINQFDPSLIPIIAEHQEEFIELLQDPAVGRSPASGAPASAPPTNPQDPVSSMIAMMQQVAAATQPGGAAGAGNS